ncbi:hypothetical protein Z043_113781 [Scleropages formosus]|uniref:Uncharacterized protein n=1 Tax=Scleropages formosus TaxID=113540 RepID=A0A0N8JYV6_SCLFO|nr:hypothetical protein Z043_113781 [Scleropages formosus]
MKLSLKLLQSPESLAPDHFQVKGLKVVNWEIDGLYNQCTFSHNGRPAQTPLFVQGNYPTMEGNVQKALCGEAQEQQVSAAGQVQADGGQTPRREGLDFGPGSDGGGVGRPSVRRPQQAALPVEQRPAQRRAFLLLLPY